MPAFFVGSDAGAPPQGSTGTTLNSTAATVWELAEPLAAGMGLEVLDVVIVGGAGRRVLRIYLDGVADDRSVTLADCEAISRTLSDTLDAHEAVAGHYMLEVSSPGLDRPLRKLEHFRRVVGQRVRVVTLAQVAGRRTFIGRLEAVGEGLLAVVDDKSEAHEIALDQIDRANLVYCFEEKRRPGRRR